MSLQLSERDQTMLALAALTACVVRTLNANGVTSKPDFDRQLEQVYNVVREIGGETTSTLQALAWVKELVARQ